MDKNKERPRIDHILKNSYELTMNSLSEVERQSIEAYVVNLQLQNNYLEKQIKKLEEQLLDMNQKLIAAQLNNK